MLLKDFREHVDSGGSVISFSGKARISSDLWAIWVRTIPEIIELNNRYKNKINLGRRFP